MGITCGDFFWSSTDHSRANGTIRGLVRFTWLAFALFFGFYGLIRADPLLPEVTAKNSYVVIVSDETVWKTTYEHIGENVKITVSFLKDGTWGDRPLAIPFPERLGRIRLVECTDDLEPLIADDFALLPLQGKSYTAGESIELTFGAYTIDAKLTSATTASSVVTGTISTPGTGNQKPLKPETLGFDREESRKILYACRYAGKNAGQLTEALRVTGDDERKDAGFLIGNMPLRDLKELRSEYLVENIRYSRMALAEAPWREEITPEIYREYILPYASLTEKREAWRKMFYEKLKPTVADCTRPGEAAVKLNRTIYTMFNVTYHPTKRPRPDQGPLESIEAAYASCTGLSVLLVNACRAVGVPARIAGVGQWTKGKGNGNHTWVEVWDKGWHCLGASESRKLNDVWFGKGAAAADVSDPLKRVYAATFSRSTVSFPLAWNPYANYVPAVDVTDWYKEQFGKKEEPKREKRH